MQLDLADKVYVVTGGSSGLGLASAEAIVAEGGAVVLVGRDAAKAERAAIALGPGAFPVAADLAATDAPEVISDAVTRTGLPLGGGVLSVGGPPAGMALDLADSQWRAAFESVVLGPVRLLRALLMDGARASGPGLAVPPAFVLVLSTSVKSPIRGLAISNALRPGLAMLTKDLADQYGTSGARFNALMPGRIDTDRIRELDGLSGDADGARQRQEGQIPLGRYGRPDELGSVAAFLLSSRASYITGAAIPVDGGALRAL